ncbi:protein terminal ear1 homolog [Eucalyptus grandis]|uniref:protein terminal ear1 homolog n=1 Tax=Eucalyptus grandis TaxID=71139 RepID=UPI00192ECA6B|nr:protein terminal ear1 homolog [Eucalyptus grandis]
MAISTILNPEAREFIPQNSSLLLQSHPPPPFAYTNLILPPSTPMISFYNSTPPPSPYFATTTHCCYQYQYYSTLPRPLLGPETRRFSANYSGVHLPPTPPPPQSNPSKRWNRAQISVELEPGLGDQKLAAGHHPRCGGRGRGPGSGRRSPPWRRGGSGGVGRGGNLGYRGRRSAWKEELLSLGVVNNSSSEEEYCCSVDTTTNIHKYPRIVEPREMVGKKKKPVVPVDEGGDRTTVMIRNIPNKYTRELLIDFLDKHCQMENQKAEGEDDGAIISAYDFVYLPLDLRRKANLGYAFVNFTSPRAVWKFKVATNNQRWELFYSSKIRQIATAKYQGKEALMRHFENTVFACDSDDFLPITFRPPRNGSGEAVTQEVVGGRIAPRRVEAQLNKADRL